MPYARPVMIPEPALMREFVNRPEVRGASYEPTYRPGRLRRSSAGVEWISDAWFFPKVLARIGGGLLTVGDRSCRAEIVGGIVVVESFEHPGFHVVAHLVVDCFGRPLFCLSRLRGACGKTSLPSGHLRRLASVLRVDVWHIRPSLDGDTVACMTREEAVTNEPETMYSEDHADLPEHRAYGAQTA